MLSETVNSCWNALRLLADAIKEFKGPIEFCSLSFGDQEQVRINNAVKSRPDCFAFSLVANTKSSIFQLADLFLTPELHTNGFPEEARQLIRVYAPYCFAAMHAKRLKRAFAISHFAQTLDGCIATSAGESKWIGCEENRVHAHRMRALCDGVLIGSGTLGHDNPQLTTRLVEGRNPTGIVLGSSLNGNESLAKAGAAPILLIGADTSFHENNIQFLKLDRINGTIPCSQILEALYQQGIYSVYIEGGAITTSHFLREQAIDILQLHFSPMILGGGKISFRIPQIQSISDSIRFDSHSYIPVGDGMMFVGTICQP